MVHELDNPGPLVLPAEVGMREAARIAGVDKKTVKKYICDGLVRWRNIAPPSSYRPTYRIELESLLGVRTSYQTSSPPTQPQRSRRTTSKPPSRRHLRHINYWN